MATIKTTNTKMIPIIANKAQRLIFLFIMASLKRFKLSFDTGIFFVISGTMFRFFSNENKSVKFILLQIFNEIVEYQDLYRNKDNF